MSWQVERAKRFVAEFLVVEDLLGRAREAQEAMTEEERGAQAPIAQLLRCHLDQLLREGLVPTAESSGDPARYMVWLRRVSACLLQACACAALAQ